MSRSEFYTTALREFLIEKQTTHITKRLNQVYEEESSTLDSTLAQMQVSSLPLEKW